MEVKDSEDLQKALLSSNIDDIKANNARIEKKVEKYGRITLVTIISGFLALLLGIITILLTLKGMIAGFQ